MLEKIQLSLRYSGRISDRKIIRFQSGYNVIVGPNGSGKSSLLEAIDKCQECRRWEDVKTRYIYFNSETMNPHRREDAFKGSDGSIIRVRAMFSSHGETMRDVLRFLRFQKGDCFLVDEPEAGQDFQWIVKIRQGLDILVKKGCQVIAASHHPVFWQNAYRIELQKGYIPKVIRLYKKYLSE